MQKVCAAGGGTKSTDWGSAGGLFDVYLQLLDNFQNWNGPEMESLMGTNQQHELAEHSNNEEVEVVQHVLEKVTSLEESASKSVTVGGCGEDA